MASLGPHTIKLYQCGCLALEIMILNSVGMEINTSESRVCLHPSTKKHLLSTPCLYKRWDTWFMSQGDPDVIRLSMNVRVIACSCMSLFFMMMVWHLNDVLYHIKLTLHVWTGDDYITPEGTVFYNGIDSCPFVCVRVHIHTNMHSLWLDPSV